MGGLFFWKSHTALLGASLSPDESVTLYGEVTDNGAGIASGALKVNLVDYQSVSVSGYQTATLTSPPLGGSHAWTVDYPLAHPLYGEYIVHTIAQDAVANSVEIADLGMLQLDNYGPVADMDMFGAIISTTYPLGAVAALGGAASDLLDPLQSKVLSLHFNLWGRSPNNFEYADATGNSSAATCDPAPCSFGVGPHGYALDPDGGQAAVPASELLNLENFSLGLWVKPTQANAGYQTLIRKDAGGTINERNFALRMRSNSTRLEFEVQAECGATGNAKTLTGASSLPLDEWSYVAATYADDKLALYIDGELDASATITTPTGVCTADNDVVIGDNVSGLLDEVAVYNRALSAEEIYHLANPLDVGVDWVKLRLRHASGSVWPDLDSEGLQLFLPMDSDNVVDVSAYANEVSCAPAEPGEATCPAAQPGDHGFAAAFDGEDDALHVSLENEIEFEQGFTAVAWFNAAETQAQRAILWQEGGKPWLGVVNDKLFTNLSYYWTQSQTTVDPNEWHHAAVSYDGATVKLYLDGNLETEETPAQPIPSNASDVVVGAFMNSSYLWDGMIDEVVVYDRALSADEIDVLANDDSWRATTLNRNDSNVIWRYRDPLPIVEGPYRIDLLTMDDLGNSRYLPAAWAGDVDLVGPSINMTITQVSGDIAQVSCEATDYNLTDAGWVCPSAGDTSYAYQDAEWFQQIFGSADGSEPVTTHRAAAVNQSSGSSSDVLDKLETLSNDSQTYLAAGDYSLTACDIVGHCTTAYAFTIQQFVEDTTHGLPGTYRGDAHWGDFDADGDLDILLTGCPDNSSCDSPLGQVYRNSGGSFSLYVEFTGQHSGGAAWGDHDNDGDLDILVSGNRGGGSYTSVYTNTGAGFSGAVVSTESGPVAWGDFDNDNDLDALLDGAIYENTGASLVAYDSLDANAGYADWGDYDNDGDLDLLMDNQVYENQDTLFDSNAAFEFSSYSDAGAWGDYDDDGDLDLLVMFASYPRVYENTPSGFSMAFELDETFTDANLAWGDYDYDNDGDLDILVNGDARSSSTPKLFVYENTGTAFEQVQSLTGTDDGSAEWGDYDGDGDLDILLVGCSVDGCADPSLIVYENKEQVSPFSLNSAPGTPSGLNAAVDEQTVTLSWNPPADTDETPAEALSYNVYVGSGVRAPMALTDGSGWQLRPALNTLVQGATLTLTVERPGDYAWSVQAVDAGFTGSPWATEGSFHVAGADLVMNKTVDSAAAQSGDTVRYTLAFTNAGPDTATGVVITDVVPLKLTNVATQVTGVAVTPIGASDYVWQVENLSDGESGSIEISGQVSGPFNAGQYIANTAQISNSAYEYDLENNVSGVMVYPGAGPVCTNYPNVVLADNPVAYYRLSDAGGIADNLGSIGSAADGSYVGASLTAGLIWQDPTLAGHFDGSDDYILVPNQNDLSGASDVKTVELWFKTDADIGADGTVWEPETHMLYEQGDGDNGLNLFINTYKYTSGAMGYKLIASVAGEGGAKSQALASITPGAIHHVVLVYENSTITAYLDGVQKYSGSVPASSIGSHNDGDVRIGANGGSFVFWWEDTNLYPFSGAIDEVAVYNSALSIDRVQAHYGACQTVDLAVRKSVNASQVSTGDSLTYTITFGNAGYAAAANVTISDTIPADVIDASWEDDGGAALVEQPGSRYRWTIASLPGGAGGVITVSGQISSSAVADTDLVNTVRIASDDGEFNTDNNLASASVQVLAPPPAPMPSPVFVLDSDASGDLPGVYYSSVDWGDYDDDGDLDVLMSGHTSVYKLTRVYRNEGNGRFADVSAGLPGVQEGSVDWGDYDDDDDLDILLSGNADSGKIASIYRNLGGDTFTDTLAGLTGVYKSTARWGDYDDNGDLDLLLTGHTGSAEISRIYRNNGSGVFGDVSAGLPGVFAGGTTWGDYDDDGDLDLLLNGNTGSGRLSTVYRNDGGSADWGDYDDDDDLDLLLAGNDGAGRIARVYRNDGGDVFTDTLAGLPGVQNGSVEWGDYDNDGDLDILISGEGLPEAAVYRNDGNDTFTLLQYEEFPSVVHSDAAWGDYDGDGDLDVLLTGQSGSNTIAQIWRNTTPLVAFDNSAYSVYENETPAVITVTLDATVPYSDVTVNYATTNGSAQAGSDYTSAGGTLVIPAGTLAVTFSVVISDDGFFEGDETVLLGLSDPDPAVLGSPYTATLTIVDDDVTPGVNVAPTTVAVAEGGATDSYQVVLTSQPTDVVTITISTDGQTGVAPTELTFDTDTWNSAQTVNVLAVDDGMIEGTPHTGAITHTAASGDPAYDGISIDDVTANIADDDSAGVSVAPTTVSVTEGGATDSYQVVLTSQPTDVVTVAITTDEKTFVDLDELTFTTSDWNDPQDVTVTAMNDAVDEGPHSSTIEHAATSNDTDYDGISSSDVTANITDNDTAGVSVSKTAVDVTEDGVTDTYQIRLNSEPTATVTINVNTDGETSVDPTGLSFTVLTWDTWRTITVTAVDDTAFEGEHSGVISHTASSSDGKYDGFAIGDVTAAIGDDDGAYENVTEAISYTLVYALDIPTNADYDDASPDYHIDNSASIGAFDRVAYYMMLSDTWAYASMPAFTSTVEHIGLPVQNLSVTIAYTTTDMNIYGSSVTDEEGVFGNIEFWSRAYTTTRNPDVKNEGGSVVGDFDNWFDFNDSVITDTGAYSGSFQIHKPVAECCTIMAWNGWDSTAVDDLGIGSAPDMFLMDWTGYVNATDYTTRTLYVLARETGARRMMSLQNPVTDAPPQQPAASPLPTDPDRLGEREEVIPVAQSSPVAQTDSAEPPDAVVKRGRAGDLHYTIVGNPDSSVVFIQSDVLTGVNSILTPTFPAAVTDTAAIPIEGYVASEKGIGSLDVTIDGGTIYADSWSGITETTWSTTWTPPDEDIYTLEAELTNDNSDVITDPVETLIYVDLNDPSLYLGTQRINGENFQIGHIVITGTVTDTIGIKQVQAKVGDGEWQTTNLALSSQGGVETGRYTATLALGITEPPTDTTYEVSVRATDRGGHTVSLQDTLPADAVAPASFDLSMTADGQPVSQGETVDWVKDPTLSLSWDPASDANGIAGYRVEWLEHTGDTAAVKQTTNLGSGSTSDTYSASETQKLSVQVTAIDGFDNERTVSFGPVYVDFGTTPVHVDLSGPYQGWLDNDCNLVGVDDRRAQALSQGDAQQFYASWDNAGLRLVWRGADWSNQGDLFIYLDTKTGGSKVAYNPYPDTELSVAIFLPSDLETGQQLEADYLVWARNDITATLLSWDGVGDQWLGVGGQWDYAFDADLPVPQTDIYLPFDVLGISDPDTQSLGLVALASEEGGLRLWAAMPSYNNLNSEAVIGASAGSDVEVFTLLKAYEWDFLGADICPSGDQFNGADLQATISAEPSGVGYGLFSHQLIFAHRYLFPDAADWDAAATQLCSGNPFVAGPVSDPLPLPSFCQRETTGSATDFLNPRWVLGAILGTEMPPVIDGQTVSYTIRVTNDGVDAAENVTVTLVADKLLTLSGGQELTLTIGSLAPGETTELVVEGTVDTTVNPGQSDGWTHLKAIVFDESGDRYHPAEELHLNHEVDETGPDYVEIQGPLSLTGPYSQTVNGFVSDQSTVPTITLEIDGQPQTCQNESSTSQWSCTVDMGDRADGEIVDLRVQAIDQHGFASGWFDGPSLVVDTTPPTLTLSTVTSYTFDGGLVGPDDTLLFGQLTGNRLVSLVEACEGDTCSPANTLIDPDTLSQTLYVYQDVPSAPIMVGPSNDCDTGTPISRTFHITDGFVIADLDVGLNLEHSFRNDVKVWLKSPNGTRVDIVSLGAAAANLDARFNDASIASVTMHDDSLGHNVAAPFYDEQRRPYADLLYDFRGESSAGDWTLEICDQYLDEDEGLYYHSQLIFRAAVAPADTEANWRYSLNLPQNVEQVQKTLTLYGYDSLGNRSETITLTFEVDTRPPVVDVSGVLELSEQGDPFTASGLVKDANDVVLRLIIRTPNGEYIADRIDLVGNSWSYSNASHFVRTGNYQVWIEAEDAAGNVTIAGSYQIERVEEIPIVPVGGYTEPMWLLALLLLAAMVVAGAIVAALKRRAAC